MPADVKEQVLNYRAYISTSDTFTHVHLTTNNTDSLTLAPLALSQSQLAQLPMDDPLILALAESHQAHTTIKYSPRIFSVSKDISEEFRTVDGYISKDD
jgi:hypothetical protein